MSVSGLCLLCLTLFIHVSAQITGTWLLDWQNSYLNFPNSGEYCSVPSTYLIISEVNASYISITSNNVSQSGPSPLCGKSTANLTLTQLNEWSQPNSSSPNPNPTPTLTYDAVSNIIFWGSLLYSRNGSVLPIQSSIGLFLGRWTNPTPYNPSLKESGCCAPQSFVITQSSSQSQSLLGVSFDSSNISCPNPNYARFSLTQASPITLNWTLIQYGIEYPMTFTYGALPDQLTVTYSSNGSCQFTYQKSSPTQILNNTWVKDWQSSNVSLAQYQVSLVNTSNNVYMVSKITLFGDQTINSFIVETSPGTYSDPYLSQGNGLTYRMSLSFTYDSTAQTLLDNQQQILLSLNGSILSSAPFIGTWTRPQIFENMSPSSECCLPSSVVISLNETVDDLYNQTNQLQVVYNLPAGYQNMSGCQNLFEYIPNYYYNLMSEHQFGSSDEFISTIQIFIPSSTQLLWEDLMTANYISLLNPSNPLQINITNPYTQCGFSMTLEEPSNPTTSSSLLMSIGIIPSVILILAL